MKFILKRIFLSETLKCWWSDILLFFILTCLTYGIVFFVLPHSPIHAFSDYDAHLTKYIFLVDELRNGRFPTRDPYIATGVPVLGDPLTFYFNPIVLGTLLLFSAETATLVQFFLATFLAMVGMWLALRKIEMPRFVVLWGSIMAGFCGTLPAAFSAGHIEKWFAPMLFPLLFILFTKTKWKLKEYGFVIGSFVFLYWSDSIYMLFYALLFFFTSRAYLFFFSKQKGNQIKLCIIVIVSTLVCIAPKLYHFIHDVMPIYDRTISDPTKGSLLFPLSFLPFIDPFIFIYERPSLQRALGFYYNWYEYFAFITPIPFLFYLSLKKVWKNQMIKMLVLFLLVGFCYLSSRYIISPFYWLYKYVPTFSNFRVPQRMDIPISTLFLLLGSYGLSLSWEKAQQTWKKVIVIFLLISVVWEIGVAMNITKNSFEKAPIDQANIVRYLKKSDPGTYFVLGYSCCLQTLLIENHIPVLNFYHGWKVNAVHPFYSSEFAQGGYKELKTIRPKYIINEVIDTTPLSTFGYTIIKTEGALQLWRTEDSTITPSLSDRW